MLSINHMGSCVLVTNYIVLDNEMANYSMKDSFLTMSPWLRGVCKVLDASCFIGVPNGVL